MSPSASRDNGFEDVDTPHPATARDKNAALLADVGATNWGLHAQHPNTIMEACAKTRSWANWDPGDLWATGKAAASLEVSSIQSLQPMSLKSKLQWMKLFVLPLQPVHPSHLEQSKAPPPHERIQRQISNQWMLPSLCWFLCSFSISSCAQYHLVAHEQTPPLYFGGMSGLLGCCPLQFPPMKCGGSWDTISMSLKCPFKTKWTAHVSQICHLFVIDLSYTYTITWVLLSLAGCSGLVTRLT